MKLACLLSRRALLAAVTLLATAAHAHGPAPAPLEVLALDGDAQRAALVRTSIGLALTHPPDSWTYVCPSQWGDNELAPAAATGTLVVTVGAGQVYRSTDGACTFEPAPAATEESWYAMDAVAWAGAVWMPATLEETGGLLRVSHADDVTLIKRWEVDEAFRCDGLLATSEGLLALGATPSPTLWRAEGDGQDPAALRWTPVPLTDLPSDASHIEPKALTDDGALWLLIATPRGRELWRGASAPGGTRTWTHAMTAEATLHGPVQVDDLWLVVQDGVLMTASSPDAWSPQGESPWTCLHTVGGAVVACSLTGVVEVTGWSFNGPKTESIFEMVTLRAPLEGCPGDPAGVAACESDWVHFGAEAGLLDPANLWTSNPNAAMAPIAEEGCQATHPVRSLLGLLTLSLLMGLRRTRTSYER